MTERALVTGATGFIGHHLTQLLIQRGDRVTCLVRPTSNTSSLDRSQLEFLLGDLRDPQSLRAATAQVEVVYHLAAALTARSRADFQAVNTEGVAALARACAERTHPPRLVVLSSLAAAGPSPVDRPATESDPAAPVSHYGRSKLAGEQAAQQHAKQLPLTIVRAPWVFGAWDRDTLRVFRFLRYGLHPVPVDRSNRYSFIHASDLAALLVLASERGERCAPGEPDRGLYYGADNRTLDYAGFGLLVAAAMSRGRPRVMFLPRGITLAMAALPSFFSGLLGRPPGIVNLDKAREGFAGSWACSPEKARQQLGFAPAATLEERLRQTVAWYREHGWL